MTERPSASAEAGPAVDLDHLRELVHGELLAEFCTLIEGKPALHPVMPLFDPDRGTLLVSSPPAFAGKIENVRENSRVAMLFHDDRGEYLATGDATVHDADPAENGEYVADLLRSEPPSDRRTVNRERMEWLDSFVGSLLMGWYTKRIVVEIEPRSLVRVGATAEIEDLPAWDAAGLDEREANRHERATVAVRGGDGYPVVQPVTGLWLREDAAVFEPEPPFTPADGQPACLLLHWADERIEHFGQRLVRGHFRISEAAFEFVPASTSTLRRDSLLDRIGFIVRGKLRTRADDRR